MTVQEYAKQILAEHGCDEYTYGGEWSKYVLDDLKEEYPNGMEFPYVEVANAIIEMSKVKPIERKPWMMCFDAEEFCDGIGFDSFDSATCDAEDTLVNWMVEERNNWKDVFHPTEEELEQRITAQIDKDSFEMAILEAINKGLILEAINNKPKAVEQ